MVNSTHDVQCTLRALSGKIVYHMHSNTNVRLLFVAYIQGCGFVRGRVCVRACVCVRARTGGSSFLLEGRRHANAGPSHPHEGVNWYEVESESGCTEWTAQVEP